MKVFDLLMVFVSVILIQSTTAQQGNEAKEKEWCFSMKEQFGIDPGQSFGTLPVQRHNEYLNARCYRFFCKPHPRAGNGKFKCESLDS